MQPRGPLMIEHRLIESMIARIEIELQRIAQTDKADPLFIDTAVDFIRTYADRTHHGKEEEIMFRDLRKKQMADDDRSLMEQLVQEHTLGRKVTAELVKANERYRQGDEKALAVIVEKLTTLIDFYPRHIEKEDKVFFPATMAYLSSEEQQQMLNEFWQFDREMIHEKYRKLVEGLSK